jgi:branched-chain amino acid transport system ATP-binding protein
MSALDNVTVASLSKHSSLTDARQHAHRELEFWGLDDFAGRLAQDLTLAQRSTLELARAMSLEPDVLLVDEVMAGLNEVEVDEMLNRMTIANQDRSTTLVIIEHNMRAIMTISHRILALEYGELIALDKPEVVSKHPKVIEAYLGVG